MIEDEFPDDQEDMVKQGDSGITPTLESLFDKS